MCTRCVHGFRILGQQTCRLLSGQCVYRQPNQDSTLDVRMHTAQWKQLHGVCDITKPVCLTCQVPTYATEVYSDRITPYSTVHALLDGFHVSNALLHTNTHFIYTPTSQPVTHTEESTASFPGYSFIKTTWNLGWRLTMQGHKVSSLAHSLVPVLRILSAPGVAS